MPWLVSPPTTRNSNWRQYQETAERNLFRGEIFVEKEIPQIHVNYTFINDFYNGRTGRNKRADTRVRTVQNRRLSGVEASVFQGFGQSFPSAPLRQRLVLIFKPWMLSLPLGVFVNYIVI